MMNKVYITGAGIATENIQSTHELKGSNIDLHPLVGVRRDFEYSSKRQKVFHSKNSIEREDRALLGGNAGVAIDAAMDAFLCSECRKAFSEDDKYEFPIFIGSELEVSDSSGYQLFAQKYMPGGAVQWKDIGKLKEDLNPLDMLRLLSTNSLYHLSKVFKLHGGGYPIRRMSLGGLCALQEALSRMMRKENRALVSAIGNMKTNENISAFYKMNLLRQHENEDGIIPSFGAAALVLESESALKARNGVLKYAEILEVRSVYKNDNNINVEDWLRLFSGAEKFRNKKINIVLYDNGVKSISSVEKKAMCTIFPCAEYFSYKPHVGYTGKANNLIDLVIALSDTRIPEGDIVLINGVGVSSGIGYILIKKLLNL